MKLSYTIGLGLTVAAAAALVLYILRNSNTRKMLEQIADEGYETAQDILFPGKNIRDRHMRYGPVIPG